jgi:mono/diheme cytochrome c family protein
MNSIQYKTLRWIAAAAAVAILAGCSGGGAPTTENPVTQVPTVPDYIGPASANADVQAFRINLWENIKANNRCGACHGAGGQTPTFARNDNVNLAYEAANTVVNLAQPDQSRLVTKVGGGHNCWLQSSSACADTMTVWIRNWAGASATGGTTIQLQAPTIKEVGGGKSFPAGATDPMNPANPGSLTFAGSQLYALVRNQGTANCVRCHSSNAASPQQPFFADADAEVAFAAIKTKVNLDNPDQSRLVVRLRDEFHNCWGSCSDNATTMLNAINEIADVVPVTQIPAGMLISKGLTLYDGTVAAGGNRYEAATIAKYEFKTGMGNIAYDTSGHEPALNLTLSGDVTWVGGWGINVKMGGKAQGSSAASKKINDLVKSTGEYTIEAWVNNANVAQEDAFIVSYSAGANNRNATLAQNAYTYQAYTRSDKTGANGNPVLITRAADEDAQAALQHVVLTYSPVEGRRIYVNGAWTQDTDAQGGGSLATWDDTYALVLGNETSTNRQWQGVMRMVAIHNRALSPSQIMQNFDAGVGEKYFMLFNVSHLLPTIPDAYVMLEAIQLDTYSLQFSKPTFISLNANAVVNNVTLEGIRIGVNGIEASVGQAYSPIRANIGATYTAGAGQKLTDVGTVVALQKTVAEDLIFLSFEKIGTGDNQAFYDEPMPATPADPPAPEPESAVGLRTFEELNASLSAITGVPQTNARVSATYELVKQSLPTVEKLGTFGASQQTAIAQLAIQYCNVLVDDNTLRPAFFGALDGNGSGTAVFGAAGDNANANRVTLVNTLLTKAILQRPGADLEFQVTSAELMAEIAGHAADSRGTGLINALVAGPTGSNAAGGRTVMKAACGAVLGSGSTLIQ